MVEFGHQQVSAGVGVYYVRLGVQMTIFTNHACSRAHRASRPAAGKRLLQRNWRRAAKAMYTFAHDLREATATIHEGPCMAHVDEVLVGCVVPPMGHVVACVRL